MEDAHDVLKDTKPFRYTILKNDRVQVFWNGRLIKTLSEKESVRFLRGLEEIGRASCRERV
jgi:phosphoketolase